MVRVNSFQSVAQKAHGPIPPCSTWWMEMIACRCCFSSCVQWCGARLRWDCDAQQQQPRQRRPFLPGKKSSFVRLLLLLRLFSSCLAIDRPPAATQGAKERSRSSGPLVSIWFQAVWSLSFLFLHGLLRQTRCKLRRWERGLLLRWPGHIFQNWLGLRSGTI